VQSKEWPSLHPSSVCASVRLPYSLTVFAAAHYASGVIAMVVVHVSKSCDDANADKMKYSVEMRTRTERVTRVALSLRADDPCLYAGLS